MGADGTGSVVGGAILFDGAVAGCAVFGGAGVAHFLNDVYVLYYNDIDYNFI